MEQIMLSEKDKKEKPMLSRVVRRYSGKRKDGLIESPFLEILSLMAWNG